METVSTKNGGGQGYMKTLELTTEQPQSASQMPSHVPKLTKLLFGLQVKVTSHLPISNDHLANSVRICAADHNATRPTLIRCYPLITKYFHSVPVKNTSWIQSKAREKGHPFKDSAWNLKVLHSFSAWCIDIISFTNALFSFQFFTTITGT